MKTREANNDARKTPEGWPGMFRRASDTGPGGMTGCCGGTWGSGDRRSMMGRCMTTCRWFPLVPVILGIALLLLGYYVDASITRVLWMLAAGILVLVGALGLIVAGRMCRGMR